MADFVKSEEKLYDERVVQIDRITRVVAGGRRLRFRATVVVGDKNGSVGVGIAKGREVVLAINKASQKARKSMVKVTLKGTTIPHEVMVKFSGAKVFLKPASKGTGVIAGGAVRAVVEVAGIHDILSKMIGSSNKINNVYATFEALKQLKAINNKQETINKKTEKKMVENPVKEENEIEEKADEAVKEEIAKSPKIEKEKAAEAVKIEKKETKAKKDIKEVKKSSK
ncbi:MAG: ribosomal protein S5 [candidate division CPR2 bacterium GW2011_GWC1_39_9]|uniref:Small ribosomal subunit protein uS5 n=1 Tax=candidate division CPR2 bacterium GW2011_GWC2_39_10 TaxID=1618345 RepID=A0A0G0PZ05_UNCC2|nr:MAG: 30S ribosomal protein S5 [candidate division CPR2 bacterium GW2011_GWC2_39_10]KKR33761.1 MAG: ribosomal protein S5 [candidate division CPR2 bacterium GW2011_GWC1_39_9]